MNTFDERVKALMKEKGLNQKDLARLTNISEASICRYLRGDSQPRYDVIKNFAKAFNVKESFLIGESDDQTIEDPVQEIRNIVARNRNIITAKERAEIIDILYGKEN